jgi:hypothetical protein
MDLQLRALWLASKSARRASSSLRLINQRHFFWKSE